MLSLRFLDAGETALMVEFGNAIDPVINERVLALDAALAAAHIEGVSELTPTFRSLTVQYDPLVIEREALIARIRMAEAGAEVSHRTLRRWTIPCCYALPHAEDIAEAAARAGMTAERLAQLHAGATYRVYMYGFSPGFPYLGGLPTELGISRRDRPRPPHPTNAVMMAGGMSAIGTFSMPTGWWVIARTPEPLYSPRRNPAFLVAVGDEIRFDPVDSATFSILEARAEAGETLARYEVVS